MRERACPLCGATAARGTVWEDRGTTATQCARCGFVYLCRLCEQAVAEARATYEAIYARHEPISELTLDSYRAILAHFDADRRSGRLVDIGCGAGAFVMAAARAGWDAIGTELAESAARVELAPGAAVLVGEHATANIPSGSSDVVTLWEVIEHLDDPIGMLGEARRLLRDGGRLYLTTPNRMSLQRRLLGSRWPRYHIEHLGYFDPRSIRDALVRAGFARIETRTKNFDPFTVLAVLSGQPVVGADATPSASAPAAELAERREGLRRFAKRSMVGRVLFRVANTVLGVTGLGDSLVAEARS